MPKAAVKEWNEFTVKDLLQTLKESNHTKYPKHQRTGGKPYGLSILINPEMDMYSTCTTNDAWGFKVNLNFFASMFKSVVRITYIR